jgi:hypothetical protein
MEAQAHSRKLTTHQQAVLIQVLLAFPEQRMGIEHCDWADGPTYAQDFLTIFNAVRWDVVQLGARKETGACASGLAIVVRGDDVPPAAEALRDALRIYAIEVETLSDSERKIAANEFVFSVGAIPE